MIIIMSTYMRIKDVKDWHTSDSVLQSIGLGILIHILL